MNPPIARLVDERIDLRKGPTVFHCHIFKIEFGAHAFVVNGPSYSGPRLVVADALIDFGTQQNPRVSRGNDCLVQKDPQTGKYVAIQYIINASCAPTTPEVAPFVLPATTYPPLGSIPPFPTLPPIGQITPPTAQGNNAYDIGDGLLDSVAALTTQEMLYFTTVRSWSIIGITAYCLSDFATLNVWGGKTYYEIAAFRDGEHKWNVWRYNGSTGVLLSKWKAPTASATLNRAFAGTDRVTVPGSGAVFRTQIITSDNAIAGFAYGLQGAML